MEGTLTDGARAEGTLTDGTRAEGTLTDAGRSNIRSYVRRSGRVTKAQRRALETEGGAYLLPLADAPLDFRAVFGNDGPVTAEIGFGMGSVTAELAAANPPHNYIGIEVFRAGIGRLLWEIGRRGLRNVRIIEGDAAALIPVMIPDGSVSAFHIGSRPVMVQNDGNSRLFRAAEKGRDSNKKRNKK